MEQDFERKYQYFHQEMAVVTDKLDDMLERQDALIGLLRRALGQAAGEQLLLRQLVQRAQEILIETDDM
ncbi:MAG: hypothetical protein FWE08_07825 [Oscillospiraceae bacterium]|nr:hypothetical protein [Oscillospiraceae bacterium]